MNISHPPIIELATALSIHDLAPTALLSNTLHAGLWELKNEYHTSDPLHACVYILCLHSVVSHEHTFITIVLHKNTAKFQQI